MEHDFSVCSNKQIAIRRIFLFCFCFSVCVCVCVCGGGGGGGQKKKAKEGGENITPDTFIERDANRLEQI